MSFNPSARTSEVWPLLACRAAFPTSSTGGSGAGEADDVSGFEVVSGYAAGVLLFAAICVLDGSAVTVWSGISALIATGGLVGETGISGLIAGGGVNLGEAAGTVAAGGSVGIGGAVPAFNSTTSRNGLLSCEVEISTGPVSSSTMRVTPGSVSATRTFCTSLSFNSSL